LFAQNIRMFQKIFFLILFIGFNTNGFCQQDSLYFSGTLLLSHSDSYKYSIIIGRNNDKWSGYSVLDEGGINETKTSLTAQFLKAKKAMIFSEKKLISTKSKESNFCYINALLKINHKKTELRGYFMGQDEQKKMCGSGTIHLNVPEKAKILLTPDGTKDSNISAIVTSHHSESFTVKSGTIKLEVWDGGLSDQDSLSISVNNELLVAPFQITNEKNTITIQLKKGENIISIKALNEGLETPNSARFLLIDGNSRYPIVSFLKKNEEATLKIKWP